ncbi:Hsp70 family protein [Desulfovibrio sp. SGI.169]|uniref:Hsp70 family protein n=1 Tax=Desulfovibrio sp. SGI.169 TaxID=3420561 RepID=UPI003D033F37
MKTIGIDLGTTNTYIYGSDGVAAEPFPLTLPRISDENGCIATVVLYENRRPLLIGNIAESEYHTNRAAMPARVLRGQFKPEIAHGDSEAAEWMTDFLRHLRAALPEGVLEPESRVYVGMPSRTREDFSLNLARCFTRAGWPRPAFVRESDAAMISCLQSGALGIDDIENRALILDFGGGTCDFTSLESMDVLQNGGDPLFGGRLFDDLLFQVFCRKNELFRREAPASGYEYYLHWIQCKAEKERFSDAVALDGAAGASLHAVWHDARGNRRDAYVRDYTREDFIRDAENYAATESLRAMLSQYADRGGLSPQARELLQGRRIGLLSWFRSILDGIEGRREVSRVILTGGSSRWFFVQDMARELFPAAVCATSRRTYEDIAYGLALYPVLAESHAAARALLGEKIGAFADHACEVVRNIVAKHAAFAVRLCTERMVERDIMPVLEEAQQTQKTVAQLERAFAENIRNDAGLLTVIREKTEALREEIQYELRQRFRTWLRQNGVPLAPRFEFPARALSKDFFDAVSVKVSRLAFLNIMDFMASAVLPGIAAYAVAGAIAHTGEAVSAVLGGGAAFAGVWALGKVAKGFLWKRKLPRFFLTEGNRRKIVEKNKVYIEAALGKAFEEVQAGLAEDAERRLRHALDAMLARLTVLNQVRCARP